MTCHLFSAKYYLYQRCIIVNRTLRDNVWWNLNQNIIICIQAKWQQFCLSHDNVLIERLAPYNKLLIVIYFNSLAPGGFENIFQNVFFKLISWIDTLRNSWETALRSMPQNPSDDKSTLVQVMAWCRQAASHYLSQCCPRSLSPYGVTRPQWVKSLFWDDGHPVLCRNSLKTQYCH